MLRYYWVISSFLEASADSKHLKLMGKRFQSSGATDWKVSYPQILKPVHGSLKKPWVEDLRAWLMGSAEGLWYTVEPGHEGIYKWAPTFWINSKINKTRAVEIDVICDHLWDRVKSLSEPDFLRQVKREVQLSNRFKKKACVTKLYVIMCVLCVMRWNIYDRVSVLM